MTTPIRTGFVLIDGPISIGHGELENDAFISGDVKALLENVTENGWSVIGHQPDRTYAGVVELITDPSGKVRWTLLATYDFTGDVSLTYRGRRYDADDYLRWSAATEDGEFDTDEDAPDEAQATSVKVSEAVASATEVTEKKVVPKPAHEFDGPLDEEDVQNNHQIHLDDKLLKEFFAKYGPLVQPPQGVPKEAMLELGIARLRQMGYTVLDGPNENGNEETLVVYYQEIPADFKLTRTTLNRDLPWRAIYVPLDLTRSRDTPVPYDAGAQKIATQLRREKRLRGLIVYDWLGDGKFDENTIDARPVDEPLFTNQQFTDYLTTQSKIPDLLWSDELGNRVTKLGPGLMFAEAASESLKSFLNLKEATARGVQWHAEAAKIGRPGWALPTALFTKLQPALDLVYWVEMAKTKSERERHQRSMLYTLLFEMSIKPDGTLVSRDATMAELDDLLARWTLPACR